MGNGFSKMTFWFVIQIKSEVEERTDRSLFSESPFSLFAFPFPFSKPPPDSPYSHLHFH